jgi:hypothetical protein
MGRSSGLVKMSVNFSRDVIVVLRDLSRRRGVTMTEVLRQAIGTEKFLDEVRERKGCVLIRDRRGHMRQLVLR